MGCMMYLMYFMVIMAISERGSALVLIAAENISSTTYSKNAEKAAHEQLRKLRDRCHVSMRTLRKTHRERQSTLF